MAYALLCQLHYQSMVGEGTTLVWNLVMITKLDFIYYLGNEYLLLSQLPHHFSYRAHGTLSLYSAALHAAL